MPVSFKKVNGDQGGKNYIILSKSASNKWKLD